MVNDELNIPGIPQVKPVLMQCPVCHCDFLSKSAPSPDIATHRRLMYYDKPVKNEVLFGGAYEVRDLYMPPNWYWCTNCKKPCHIEDA